MDGIQFLFIYGTASYTCHPHVGITSVTVTLGYLQSGNETVFQHLTTAVMQCIHMYPHQSHVYSISLGCLQSGYFTLVKCCSYTVSTHIHVSLISDLLLATTLQSPQDGLASTNSYCMVQPDSRFICRYRGTSLYNRVTLCGSHLPIKTTIYNIGPNNILYTHLKCWPEGGRIIEVHRTVHVLAQYPLIKYWFYALPHSSS